MSIKNVLSDPETILHFLESAGEWRAASRESDSHIALDWRATDSVPAGLKGTSKSAQRTGESSPHKLPASSADSDTDLFRDASATHARNRRVRGDRRPVSGLGRSMRGESTSWQDKVPTA